MSTTDVLFVIAMMSCIASAAVLGSLTRHRIAGLDRWLVAHCLLFVTFGILVMRRGDYPPLVILGACFSVLGAAILLLQGCRRFARRPTVGKIERLALPVAACAVLYWTVVDPNENARAAVMSSVLGYTRMATGWTVWNSGANGERHYGHWLVNVAAGVGTAVHGYRVVQCIFFADPTASALEPTASNIGFVSFGILSLLLLSIGLVMLVNDSLVNHARRLATVDELTGLLARRELLSRGEALIKAARLSRARLSVAVIDLDDFKTINDRYGHPAGDRVLRNFAKEVSRRLGCTDVFGRLGGEEFAIFFPQTASEQAAELIGTIQSSGHREQTREHDPWCTFSAGIDECCVNDTLSELISRADAALYRAKRKGKGRVELAKSDCDVSIA